MAREIKSTTIQARVTETFEKRAEAIADAAGKSLSEWAREVLQRAVEREERRRGWPAGRPPVQPG